MLIQETQAKGIARTFRNQPLKGNIMNLHKHMEAVFVVALATAGLGSFALDSLPEGRASTSAAAPVMRDVAAHGSKQDAASVAMLCASKAARRA